MVPPMPSIFGNRPVWGPLQWLGTADSPDQACKMDPMVFYTDILFYVFECHSDVKVLSSLGALSGGFLFMRGALFKGGASVTCLSCTLKSFEIL